MDLMELLPLLALGSLVSYMLVKAFWIDLPFRRDPPRRSTQTYKCHELVPQTDLAVNYRDNPMSPCGQSIDIQVVGDCTPLCPRHHRPMNRVN